MKKKGFTLIELLAVIVILAIIALIATPTILGVIEKARKGATEQSALGYIDAIEKQIMINDTNNIQELKDGTYLVEDINISYKGKGPTKGTVTIKKGEVTTTNLCFKTYSVDYDGTKATISKNNYCKEDKVILKEKENINEITIENKKAVIDLTNYTDYTNIHCNNNAKLEIENNQLIVTNIIGEVTCQLDKTLEDTFSNLDDSSNSVMMLSDETLSNGITIEKNKNVTLDLNGKKIEKTFEKYDRLLINKGNLTINDKNNLGIIKTNFAVIINYSKIVINGGNYIRENPSSTSGGVLSLMNGEAIINGGVFQTDKTYAILNMSNKNQSTLTVKNATVTSESNGFYIGNENATTNIIHCNVKSTNTGTAISNNGKMYIENTVAISNKGYSIWNANKGNLVINSGEYISEKNTVIANTSSYDILIKDEKGKTYIASYTTENDQKDVWQSKAIFNKAKGNIKIEGSIADSCGKTLNKTGTCIYMNYGRAVLNENNSEGNIYIAGSYINSENYAIYNYTGNIYICDSKIEGKTSFRLSGKGYIYYNSKNIFDINTSLDINNPSHFILDDTICKG